MSGCLLVAGPVLVVAEQVRSNHGLVGYRGDETHGGHAPLHAGVMKGCVDAPVIPVREGGGGPVKG